MMRNRMTVILGLVVTLCMMTGNVQGQKTINIDHLRKENPNEIWVLYFQDDDCSGNYEQIVEAELAQSRIKRKEYYNYDETVLRVTLECMALSNEQNLVFNIDVYFGKFAEVINPEPDEYDFTPIMYFPNYGSLGIAGTDSVGEQFIKNGVRDSVEAALTNYLKTNFDL